jgi:Xaa-Pro dipeptidase
MSNEESVRRQFAHLYDGWLDIPGSALERDFPEEEYELRKARARALMASDGLDALVVTSSGIGSWFTSRREPHEWHDVCQARSAWYILMPDTDHLFMSPTAGGEHMNTTRRSTWVSEIGAIVERTDGDRHEIWALEQIPEIFAELGIEAGRLGFELGDCMTLGMNLNDFLRLRELVPHASLVDASAIFRRLMSIHTPFEIENVREACRVGVEMHATVGELLRVGLTERELFEALRCSFEATFGDDSRLEYQAQGVWDVRNPARADSPMFHAVTTDHRYDVGDVVFRGWSGVWCMGYIADIDRVWSVGRPSRKALEMYRVAWESNRAMAAAIRPGATCADVYAAGTAVEQRNGLPERLTGRTGHGLRNTGGLSVHPGNRTTLEPGMILSVEPMYATEHGFFDLEDQYLVVDDGAEALHEPAPEEMPVVL